MCQIPTTSLHPENKTGLILAKIIAILLLFTLVACSSATEEPIPTQTKTPAPTSTVAPTQTATLEPTQTPIPTSTPTQTEIPTQTPIPKPIMRERAMMTLLQFGEFMFQSGDYLGAKVLLTEMLEYAWNQDTETMLHSLRSDCELKLGEFDSAIADLSVAVDYASSASDLNLMCWYNGITGQAEEALQFCEQAVKADPSSMNRDSRGLVYAQLGEFEAAIEDFQSVVDDYKNSTDPGLKNIHDSRQEWLETLQAGNNPITPEVLEQLQQDEIIPSTPIFNPEDYGDRTRAGFQRSAQDVGFKFGQVEMSGGQEFITGVLSEGDCEGELVLTGPEAGITAATIHLAGCKDDYQQGKQYWFMSQFLSDYSDVIRATVVWGSTDIYYVIEGIEKETVTKQFGDVRFSVRNIPGDLTTFEITADVLE